MAKIDPKELYKTDLERIDAAKELRDIYKQLAGVNATIGKATAEQVQSFEDQLDIAEQLAENEKNIFANRINTRGIAQKIITLQKTEAALEAKKVKTTGTGSRQKKKDLNAQIEEIQKNKAIYDQLLDRGIVQKGQRKEVDKTLKSHQKAMVPVKKMAAMIPGIGSTLSSAIDAYSTSFEKGLGKSMEGLTDKQKKAKKNFMGMSAATKVVGLAIATYIGKNLFAAMQSMGGGLMDVLSRPEFIFFGSESRAIADEFGNMNESSMKLGLNMKLMSIFSGVSAQNQAKIMGMMAATSDSSNTALLAQMKTYKQAGVPFKAIMDDVASNTEHFAKFAKDGGANIFDAAKKAKELGVNLGDVASISNSLLNFESSIEAQMNAQVLLGKNISLDKARQLAFTGDQAGMMDEIVKQVGGEAEFNKLNVIQRQALADSVGLTVEKMGALVRAEEAGAEAGKANFLAFVGLGALVVGIAAAVIGALTGGVGVKASLKGAAKGLTGGIILGGAGGAAAASMGKSIPSFQTGPDEFKNVEKTGLAEVHQGETVGRFSTKTLEAKMDKLIAIVETMSPLPNAATLDDLITINTKMNQNISDLAI
jgi:hypothetical protein